MRSLIEEYGYTIIAVFATTVMIIVIMFGRIIPIMNEYTVGSIPEDVVKNEASKEALEESLERAKPTITAEDTITFKSGESVSLKEAVSAKNADGEDISDRITFSFSDDDLKARFNKSTGVLDGNGLSAGEYKVVVSVVEAYFRGSSQKTITIIVQQ